MSEAKPYKQSMPKDWYMKSSFYKLYMIREATAIFMVWFAVIFTIALTKLDDYESWQAFFSCPLLVVINLLTLAAALFHAKTWFELAPSAMPPIFIGDKKLAPEPIIMGQWVALGGISLIMLLIAVFGG
jgi:fumarate reductase subunit C